MRLYATIGGFMYWIKPKPLLGAYVAMETFARALLEYGHFDEYHAYHDDEFFRSLSHEELIRAFFRSPKLKVKKYREILREAQSDYRVLHTEACGPHTEVILRGVLSRKNIPLTKRFYAVATNGHLMGLLHVCTLGGGGRPYDSIIVPSRAAQAAVRAYFADVQSFTAGRLCYRGRVDVIPHGLYLESLAPRDKSRSREKYDIPRETTVLLSLARISRTSKMNYDRLLEFFAQLVRRTPRRLLLVIAGSDTQHEAQGLTDLAQRLGLVDQLKIITDFPDEDKADILNCADIFLSLSDNLQESFGINLIEAMAMALPVVCTDWDGYKDIVDEGVTGYRIPTTWTAQERPEDAVGALTNLYDHAVIHRISRGIRVDMDALIARTLELIEHEATRRNLGDKGREKAEREYSARTEILRWEALWQELGEMAQKDEREYPDLSPLLNYRYPRHFRTWPTYFDPALQEPAPGREPAVVPEDEDHEHPVCG